MFYIDSYNKDDSITFEEAKRTVTGSNPEGSLLDSMMALQTKLESVMDQEDFCDDWCYEINAYNKVFSDMGKLFA